MGNILKDLEQHMKPFFLFCPPARLRVKNTETIKLSEAYDTLHHRSLTWLGSFCRGGGGGGFFERDVKGQNLPS